VPGRRRWRAGHPDLFQNGAPGRDPPGEQLADAVRLAWWRDDPHPAAGAVVALLTELYRRG
jgi:hypothetical protein